MLVFERKGLKAPARSMYSTRPIIFVSGGLRWSVAAVLTPAHDKMVATTAIIWPPVASPYWEAIEREAGERIGRAGAAIP